MTFYCIKSWFSFIYSLFQHRARIILKLIYNQTKIFKIIYIFYTYISTLKLLIHVNLHGFRFFYINQ